MNILNPDGTLNDNAGPYAGLDRFEARAPRRRRPPGPGARRERRGPRDRDRPLRPLQDPDRAVPLQAVVRPDGRRPGRDRLRSRDEEGIQGRGLAQACIDAVGREYALAERTPADFRTPIRALRRHLRRLALRKARLVHQPPAVVGPPHPDLARRVYAAPGWPGSCAGFPKSGPSEVAAWVSDEDGRSFPPSAAASGKLDPATRYALLVCLRDEAAAEEARRGARARSASPRTRTSSTPGSARPSGRSRTLGWPDPATAEVDPGQRTLAATPRPGSRTLSPITIPAPASSRPATSSPCGSPGWC